MNTKSLRFSRDLLTPRKDISERDPELIRSPLISSQRFRRIEAVYLGSERLFDDTVEAADEVGHMVRHTLSFGSLATQDAKLWGWDERADTVKTNCFGYTVVTSELLSSLEIPHFVSFVNAHAFITLYSDDSQRAHMLDTPSKDLFLDIDGAVRGKWPPEVLEQQPNLLYTTSSLDSTAVLGRVTRRPAAQVAMENAWLRGERMLKPGYDDITSQSQLTMRSYPPQVGRDMLVNYGMMVQYVASGQLHAAVNRFRRLDGVYPDVGESTQLYMAKKLRDRLLKAEMYGEMEDIARVVDNSLVKTGFRQDKTTNKFFLLDTLRMVAFSNNNAELLRGVADAYMEFGSDRHTQGKAAKARQLAARVEASKPHQSPVL